MEQDALQTVSYYTLFFTEKVETKGRKVFFEDPQTGSSQPRIPYDGVPFTITGKRVYDCHQGIDRHAADKRRLKSNKVCTFVAARFRSLTSIVFTNCLISRWFSR